MHVCMQQLSRGGSTCNRAGTVKSAVKAYEQPAHHHAICTMQAHCFAPAGRHPLHVHPVHQDCAGVHAADAAEDEHSVCGRTVR
eukprot:230278-Chlamydomonas_euryale.AAC.12